MTPRIGSLFSGYGGLDMAVQSVYGGEVVWYSEIEKAACQVLAAHHPSVPNLGDITAVDWAAVPPIDILTGGYPCQPFSHAGKRAGTDDERHLWPYVRDAIAALRPMVTVLENVDGHRSLGLDVVLGDLADLGLPARWGVVRAADAGAPHGRKRVFIVIPADTARGAGGTWPGRGLPESEGSAGPAAHLGDAAADANGSGLQGSDVSPTANGRSWLRERATNSHCIVPSPHPQGGRRGAGQGPAEAEGGREVARAGDGGGSAAADAAGVDAQESERAGSWTGDAGRQQHRDSGATDWGKYAPAITRWESVLGRRAPSPTIPGRNGRPRLSPAFVEWMMGLPAGHVTGHGLKAAAELKMLGNGVCPQQAELALRMILGFPATVHYANTDVLPTPVASVSAPAPWKPGVDWWLQSRAARNLEAIVTGNTPHMQAATDA